MGPLMPFVFAILPIVLTIAVGLALAQSRIIPREQWAGIEALSFRLLIPVVLFSFIIRTDLDPTRFGPLTLSLVLALTIAGAIVLLIGRFSNAALSNGSLTTLFQTTIRWNAFIALAAAEFFGAPSAIALIAVAMAVLIPLINVACIVVLAVWGAAVASPQGVGLAILKNPLVQASVLGVALNLLGLRLGGAVAETLDLIGRAGFGIGLLAVGAGMDLGRLARPRPLVGLALILRLVFLPVVFVFVSWPLELEPDAMLAGLLVLSVPAATNGYIIAKAMGGDAELYADALAWQTLASLVLLPLIAAYALGS